MQTLASDAVSSKPELAKAPTGIHGLDEITFGGLPAGRPTLICGSAGCGKTLFGMTFLINGITQFDEPGVIMTFEEKSEDLAKNVQSLGYDANELMAQNKLMIDYVRVERSEIEESGEYDLEGLFIRLGYAIKKTGAKRVLLDTLEALFTGLSNPGILRAELRRLFEWLKEQGVSAVITGERGDGTLTRHGLEEYISDCVILLDNRVNDQLSTRRLRVVKYRGSAHGSNEYPFLIDSEGISVLPITSVGLAHQTTNEIVSTGISDLDTMFGKGGIYRGTSVLLSGASGTGKSLISASFANSVCQRGEKCLYFAFEESPDQIIRNTRSVGIDLQPYIDQGLLCIESARPSLYGLEMHLTLMNRKIQTFQPTAVIIDPISAFRGIESEVYIALLRIVDILKSHGITGLFTNLLKSGGLEVVDTYGHELSSLMDTWLYLNNIEHNGERNRGLYVLKSRGMSHSNQIREFSIQDDGIRLVDVYVGFEGVLTGSARLTQEAKEKEELLIQSQQLERRQRELAARKCSLENQIAELQIKLDNEEAEISLLSHQTQERKAVRVSDQANLAISRGLKNNSDHG
jgi:circadian clock protein KaiC